MKKNVFGRRFRRDKNERKALFKSLLSALVLEERIKTTEPKAKAIRADADKIVTKAKKDGEFAKRLLGDVLNSQALEKLINDIAPRFKNRNGGYTRIIRVGKRFGDNAMEVVMEWTEGKSAGPLPAEEPAHKASPKKSDKTRSLSEGRPQSSLRTTKRKSRPSVAPRSAKSPSQRRKKAK